MAVPHFLKGGSRSSREKVSVQGCSAATWWHQDRQQDSSPPAHEDAYSVHSWDSAENGSFGPVVGYDSDSPRDHPAVPSQKQQLWDVVDTARRSKQQASTSAARPTRARVATVRDPEVLETANRFQGLDLAPPGFKTKEQRQQEQEEDSASPHRASSC